MIAVKPDIVAHFAALAYVGELFEKPDLYYHNNCTGMIAVLDAMRAARVRRLLFSSTCATYGLPLEIPIDESHPQNPINPYGWSKLFAERMLSDYAAAFGLEAVCRDTRTLPGRCRQRDRRTPSARDARHTARHSSSAGWRVFPSVGVISKRPIARQFAIMSTSPTSQRPILARSPIFPMAADPTPSMSGRAKAQAFLNSFKLLNASAAGQSNTTSWGAEREIPRSSSPHPRKSARSSAGGQAFQTSTTSYARLGVGTRARRSIDLKA